QETPGAGPAVSRGRDRAVLRPLAQGGRDRSQSHSRVARDPLRPLVEPRRGESGHGSRIPHRSDEERARTQVLVSRDGRGEDRPAHRLEAAAVRGPAGKRRRPAADRDEQRRAAEARRARSSRSLAGITPRNRTWITTTI